MGIYEFACLEGARPWFADIIAAGDPLREKFTAAVMPGSIITFASKCGQFDLVLGVRREFPNFDMPEASEEQRAHSVRFWNQEYINE